MTENDEQSDLAREADALPREIEPGRDLWAGVAQRIEAKRRRVVLVRRSVTGVSVLLAAAAIALVIRAERHPQATGPAPRLIASEPTAVYTAPPTDPPAMKPLIPEEASYQAALAALTPVFEERKKDLPPEGAAALGKSLGAIDAAITATRASLATQPEDDDLRRELDSEYEQKIDTMNDVLDWTTRS